MNTETHLIGRLCHRLAAVLLVALAWSSTSFGGEIHDAARKGDLEMVKALLNANPELALSKETNGATALHWAALLGHKEVAELLLVNKAEVDARDSAGETPLIWAAYKGHKDVVELLLANKANVNAKDRIGATPLHAAAQYGHTDVAELLLASKADINAANNVGETPLHFAAAAGHGDMAVLLRQHGGYDGSNISSVAAAPFKSHSLKQDLEGIEGTWKLVALENNGQQAPAEFVVVMKLVFKGDTLTFPGGEPGFTNYKFELDPTTTPASFTMAHADGTKQGESNKGIYSLDGDCLQICFGKADQLPKELTAKAGSGQFMYSLEREK